MKRLAVFLLLLLSQPSLAAITYFGTSSTPTTDNGSQVFNTTAVAIAPPASMTTGMVAMIFATWHGCTSTQTLTIGVTGGQSWTSETNHAYDTPDNLCVRVFWARFNGTWAANPTVVPLTLGTYTGVTLRMVAFSPTTSTNTWAVDVAESAALFAAPGGSFDITIAGQTAVAASTVTVGMWHVHNVATFGTLSGGWTYPSAISQIRNPANNKDSMSLAYKIQTSSGATGSPSNRASSNTAGATTIITLKEVGASASWTTTPFVSARTSTTHTVSAQATASGTLYAVGCTKGSTAPTIAQVKAGQCTGSVAALAANSKSITTAADTLVLTYASPLLVYDVYAVGTLTGVDTALVSMPTEIAGAASGYTTPFALTAVCTVNTCPVKVYNDKNATDLVVGDYVSYQTTTSPNTYAATWGTDGSGFYSLATQAKQTILAKYYDVSAGAMFAGADPVTLIANNTVPSCGTGILPLLLERNVAVTPFELSSACVDADGDALTAAITSGSLNTGLAMSSTGQVTGTPTVNAPTGNVIDVTFTDTAGDTAVQKYDIFVTADVTIPDCTGVTAAVCIGLVEANGWLTAIPVYQYSSSVAAGYVISTDPTGTVDLFSSVTIYISLGTINVSPAVSGYTFSVDPDAYAVIYGAAWLWHSKPSPTCSEIIAHVGALSSATVTSVAGEQVTLPLSNLPYPRQDVGIVSVNLIGECSVVSAYPGLKKSPGTNRIYLPVDVP